MADQIAPVAVRLGGTFATLADSEARHRALLIEAEQLCAKSESMLASERQEVARLNCELEKASECAASWMHSALAAQRKGSAIGAEAQAYITATSVLRDEVVQFEADVEQLRSGSRELSSELRETREALECERRRTTALTLSLCERDQSLEDAAAREAALKKELGEERQRLKRSAAARAEKEKQLIVLSSEKQRLAALLSKKDSLARELTVMLKRRSAGADGEGDGARAGGGSEDEPAALRAVAWRTTLPARAVGAWGEQDANLVSPAVPGVQKRFEGWRDASPAQRFASLKAENAVLIGVLAERDGALAAAHADVRRLTKEHGEMLAKWREARRGQQARREAVGSSAAELASRPKESPVKMASKTPPAPSPSARPTPPSKTLAKTPPSRRVSESPM